MSRLILFALLPACSYEFGLTHEVEKGGSLEDTGTPVTEEEEEAQDSAPPEDTGEVTDDVPPKEEGTEDSAPPDEDPPDDTTVEEEPPEDDCTETSDLIYVLSRDNSMLYLFDPATLDFTELARLSCGTSQTPGSMAVSRDGRAFVRYANNDVYEVDLSTYACSPTMYSDRATGFDSFGMGYATDSSTTWHDQLYVANANRLAVLDTTTWSLTEVGPVPSQSELTGNADGELWAFLPLEHPAEVVQLDRSTGATLTSIPLPGFPSSSDIDTFAFATWDGEFWLFVREYGMGSSTDVYNVSASGTLTKVRPDIGFDIVGAGVSTCAPS